MAVTGVITCSPDGVKPNEPFNVTLVLTNSSTVMYVGSITPKLKTYGGTAEIISAASGLPLGPGSNITIGASGTLTLKWKDIIFAPITPNLNSMFCWYEVGATIRLTDATVVTATGDLVGVYSDSASKFNTAFCGLMDFSQFENSGYIAAI